MGFQPCPKAVQKHSNLMYLHMKKANCSRIIWVRGWGSKVRVGVRGGVKVGVRMRVRVGHRTQQPLDRMAKLQCRVSIYSKNSFLSAEMPVGGSQGWEACPHARDPGSFQLVVLVYQHTATVVCDECWGLRHRVSLAKVLSCLLF